MRVVQPFSLFLSCGIVLTACAGEPAPALKAAAPSQQPPLPAGELRSRMLALVDSLKTYADTNAPHVEKVMELKLMPLAGWRGGIRNFGTFKEGGAYNLWVNPEDGGKSSDIEFRFYPDGKDEPHKSGTQICSYDANAVAKDLLATGYTRFDWPQVHGAEIWGFERPAPSGKFWFQIAVYVYHVTDGANRSSPRPCIRSLKIVSGDEQ